MCGDRSTFGPEKVRPGRNRLTFTIVVTVLLLYIGLYVVGLLVGLAAKIVLDVQVRRPGFRQGVGLIILALVLWGALSITHAPFTDVLLPLVWAGTGLLAGVGSRELRTAS
jgi:hypothetical protein